MKYERLPPLRQVWNMIEQCSAVYSLQYSLQYYSQSVSQFGVIRNMLTLNIIFAQDKSHVSQSCVLSVCNISKCKQPGSRSRVAGVLLTNINHLPLN